MSALPRRLPRFSAVIHRRALATRPPQPDPPLSAATQDLLHRLAKDAARNTAPGATVRGGGKEAPYVGSVGPFNLGVGLGSNIRTKDWKKWRELGLGGKMVRMTTQTGNLTVILFGGTLFALLAYALTTELFAKNSPTVLHGQAIDRIESSKVMQQHLLKPYSFTHHPSSSPTTRHSSPLQTQHLRHPQTSHEHLLMRFWVHGRALDEVETLGWLKAPLRDARAWIGEQVEVLREQYLMDRLDGEVVEEGIRHADKEHRGVVTQREGESARTAGTGWLDGLFGALNPSTTGGASSSRTRGGSGVGKRKALPPAGTYTSGEVHADFVKDPETETYRLLTLTVDIPSSRFPGPQQRAVVFWADPDEVAKEGLLEGSRTRLAW